MQAADLAESRNLYDQLAPLTPVMLALTAATPFLRGWICDDDTRWSQVAQSVDDRTEAERSGSVGQSTEAAAAGDDRLAGGGIRPLRKSRYDSIDCYIGEGPEAVKHNDLPLVIDEEYARRLMDGGVDETLARHIAHLFARDPLVLFGDRIHLDDNNDIDHWENLQSTNWQTLRWKPPPPDKGALSSSADGHIGWRVEFRSMEVQMTDFENAAFTSFIVLLSRTILALKLNLYIPMSKLEENMQAGQRKQACTEERFWFRTDVLPLGVSQTCTEATTGAEPYALMTVQEILMGRGSYPGLIPLCFRYLETSGCDPAAREALAEHLAFIEKRASGSLMTTATWMRNFVLTHEAYQNDARVPHAAAHDLMLAASEIGAGTRQCLELVGERPAVVSASATPVASQPSAAEPCPGGPRRTSSCACSVAEEGPKVAMAIAVVAAGA
jgi:glutamate--cysteine ligase catalytic subunit